MDSAVAYSFADILFDNPAQLWYKAFLIEYHYPNSCEEDEYALGRWLRERGHGESPAHTSALNGPQSCKANVESCRGEGNLAYVPTPVARAGVATVIRAKSISHALLPRPYSTK